MNKIKEMEIANKIAIEQLLNDLDTTIKINKSLINNNYELIIKNKKILKALDSLLLNSMEMNDIKDYNIVLNYIKQTRNFLENEKV